MHVTASVAESERLAALNRYQILDTPPERPYDELTALAAQICATPIAMITLIDEERQWFKAKVGVDVDSTPRCWAVCNEAIRHDHTFTVQDASIDSRFSASPLVTGAPHIRAYAGAQLSIDGCNLGTLCVIDDVPGSFSNNRVAALETLRDAVVAEIERSHLWRENRALNEEILSVCAWCDNVRNETAEQPRWDTPMQFILDRFQVSHSICPDCHLRVEGVGGLEDGDGGNSAT
ncbi:MAG: GAF domain-containing protein [Pseudomonadota bacterium]